MDARVRLPARRLKRMLTVSVLLAFVHTSSSRQHVTIRRILQANNIATDQLDNPACKIVDVSAGGFHTCGIVQAGGEQKLKCWGDNSAGQLGSESTAMYGNRQDSMGDALPFVDLGVNVQPIQVAGGFNFTCVLTSPLKKVKCFGDNTFGELGINTTTPKGGAPGTMSDALPYVELPDQVQQIAAGDFHACALTVVNKVYCWGANFGSGILGQGNTVQSWGAKPNDMGRNVPSVDFGTNRTAIFIAAGVDYTCAILDNKAVRCWGYNGAGQLGQPGYPNGLGYNRNTTGGQVPNIDLGSSSPAVHVMAGRQYGQTCVVLEDGTLKCFGANEAGQLGLGDTNNRGDQAGEMGTTLPAVFLGNDSKAVQTAGGAFHTCAMYVDSNNMTQVKCWGDASYDQFYGPSVGALPGQMETLQAMNLGSNNLSRPVQITAGGFHTCVRFEDGRLKCFGGDVRSVGVLGLGSVQPAGVTPETVGDKLPFVDVCGSWAGPALDSNGPILVGATSGSQGSTGTLPGTGATSTNTNTPGITTTNTNTDSQQPATASKDGGGSSSSKKMTGVVAGAVVGGSVLLLAAALLFMYLRKTRRRDIDPGDELKGDLIGAADTSKIVLSVEDKLSTDHDAYPLYVSMGSNSKSSTGNEYPAKMKQSQGEAIVDGVDRSTGLKIPASRSSGLSSQYTTDNVTGSTSHNLTSSSASTWATTTTAPTPNPCDAVSGNAADGNATKVFKLDDSMTRPGLAKEAAVLGAAGVAGFMMSSPTPGGVAMSPTARTTTNTLASSEDLQLNWSDLKLGKKIGTGGFGEVWRATWQGHPVAVKMMLNCSPKELQDLRHEADIMSKCYNPNIARVYGIADDGSQRVALVMQFYRSGSLASFISCGSYEELDILARLDMSLQVARGMRYMHERPRPILHLDLKTSNILLEESIMKWAHLDRPRLVACIADFGLSGKATDTGGVEAVASTPSITPPEVFTNRNAPRMAAADVYAFGVVLLEIVTGRRAWEGLTGSQLRYAVVAGKRPQIPDDVPADVAALIQACWAQDPASRPSFGEITVTLESATRSCLLSSGSDRLLMNPNANDTAQMTQMDTTMLL